MDDIVECGKNVRFIDWWLIHHSHDADAPVIVSQLAALTQATVQVLVSGQTANKILGQELRIEAARSLTAAAGKLVEGAIYRE